MGGRVYVCMYDRIYVSRIYVSSKLSYSVRCREYYYANTLENG